jgi:hypothetical protein
MMILFELRDAVDKVLKKKSMALGEGEAAQNKLSLLD